MPVAHVINDCLTLPQGRQAQFNIPVKAGQNPDDIKTKDVIAAFLVPCQTGAGHVVSWSFGGAQRVKRKGDKFHITAEEAGFVMNNIPGLIELVDESDSGDQTTALLNDRVRKLEQELRLATGRADTAESQVKALQAGGSGASQAAASGAAALEAVRSDLVVAHRTIDGLQREVEALKHTENGLLRVEHTTLLRRVQLLENRLNPAQLAEVKAELEAVPPTATQPAEDPAVAALRAREEAPTTTDEEDEAELLRIAAKGDKEPVRTQAEVVTGLSHLGVKDGTAVPSNSTNAPRRGPDNKPVNPPQKK